MIFDLGVTSKGVAMSVAEAIGLMIQFGSFIIGLIMLVIALIHLSQK